MSQPLISRSPDLRRLQDEGYGVEIRCDHLVIGGVPYVNSRKEVKYGLLVSELTLAGDVTTRPHTHVAFFAGEHPCNKEGVEITQIKHQSATRSLGDGLVVDHSFSSKPTGGYEDFHHKMSTYCAIISSPAQAIDSNATPKAFPIIDASGEASVFQYVDTASTRAGIGRIAKKLNLEKVAIVGLGGTGSYVLDLVAKTPVREIHLFDGDKFSQHNAFRAPGAPSIDELRTEPPKVLYFKDLYSRMHRGIAAHNCYVDEANVGQLQGMDFVFLCLDQGGSKRFIVDQLETLGTPFIDVGMGIQLVGDALIGVLRTTTSTHGYRDHVRSKGRISFSSSDGNNEYSRNIQIADLNALNAALAVVKWKKLFGYYLDLEKEHYCTYTIDGNAMANEDKP